jgi:hypothetical protein
MRRLVPVIEVAGYGYLGGIRCPYAKIIAISSQYGKAPGAELFIERVMGALLVRGYVIII